MGKVMDLGLTFRKGCAAPFEIADHTQVVIADKARRRRLGIKTPKREPGRSAFGAAPSEGHRDE